MYTFPQDVCIPDVLDGDVRSRLFSCADVAGIERQMGHALRAWRSFTTNPVHTHARAAPRLLATPQRAVTGPYMRSAALLCTSRTYVLYGLDRNRPLMERSLSALYCTVALS